MELFFGVCPLMFEMLVGKLKSCEPLVDLLVTFVAMSIKLEEIKFYLLSN